MATIYYTGCTLDGFIATDDHSLDWLTSRDIDNEGPMAYPAFRDFAYCVFESLQLAEQVLRKALVPGQVIHRLAVSGGNFCHSASPKSLMN